MFDIQVERYVESLGYWKGHPDYYRMLGICKGLLAKLKVPMDICIKEDKYLVCECRDCIKGSLWKEEVI
jgi:hypothetical protein